jgi:hypothetical protein
MTGLLATHEHIRQVQSLLMHAVVNLQARLLAHDRSKLESPEAEVFEEYTPKLSGSTYGSAEYKGFRAAMKPALEHHYAHNRHHPEHYHDGIRGMSLLDLVEMLVDWKAATLRHADGDLRKSIEVNQQRFGYSNELKAIFVNTAVELGLFPPPKE